MPAAIGLMAFVIPIAIAQVPRPAFEVASVKPATNNFSIVQLDSARYTGTPHCTEN
jgi:hypothetical protein